MPSRIAATLIAQSGVVRDVCPCRTLKMMIGAVLKVWRLENWPVG